MVTKAMWPSTPTARSSPALLSRRATPGTPASPPISSKIYWRCDGNGTEDDDGAKPKVYGDNAYGTGEFQSKLEGAGIASGCKTQSPTAAGGLFTKDRFDIDLGAGTVTCPNNVTVDIRRGRTGPAPHRSPGRAPTARYETSAPLRPVGGPSWSELTKSALARARDRQKDPGWAADYRATRPKVERKLGHLMRRRHGGRRARVRGRPKVDADFNLLAAATNLARFAALGLRSTPNGWAAGA